MRWGRRATKKPTESTIVDLKGHSLDVAGCLADFSLSSDRASSFGFAKGHGDLAFVLFGRRSFDMAIVRDRVSYEFVNALARLANQAGQL